MRAFRLHALGFAGAVIALALAAHAEEIKGAIKSIDQAHRRVTIAEDGTKRKVDVLVAPETSFGDFQGRQGSLDTLKEGTSVIVSSGAVALRVDPAPPPSTPAQSGSILGEFWYNFRHNLFKPLLLFFYMGFLVPILRVKLEFPYVVYQALVIYLLLAIGWHGGEELSDLDSSVLAQVLGFMLVGFATNFLIGILAYQFLTWGTRLRRVDKATVAGYYGSDSAGTFVTCLGVLASTKILYDAYMPVMLAIMEIPGCLVALYLVSKLRREGMDPLGNMPGEPGYDSGAAAPPDFGGGGDPHGHDASPSVPTRVAGRSADLADGVPGNPKQGSILSAKLLHEVFLNSGLYLLFGGIAIGFISGIQGKAVTREDDRLFLDLFQGVLCLFLLEMGMTASRKLQDLRQAGWRYVVFGLVAPNIFAIIGISVAHTYSLLTHTHFALGTYVLFAVLCAAASYIAVPAVQRLAIPEASPTLPLAASLGLTFSYNVTVGIPVYIELAKLATRLFPG